MDTYNENSTNKEYKLWVRALYMFVFALIFRICEITLYLLAIVGLIYRAVYKKNNQHMVKFGHSLATYVQQLSEFLSFNTEQAPFPFDTWPGSNKPTQNTGEPDKSESESFEKPKTTISIDEPGAAA